MKGFKFIFNGFIFRNFNARSTDVQSKWGKSLIINKLISQTQYQYIKVQASVFLKDISVVEWSI